MFVLRSINILAELVCYFEKLLLECIMHKRRWAIKLLSGLGIGTPTGLLQGWQHIF